MPNLKRLFIQGECLSDLAFIKKLTFLEELKFYDCELKSVKGIESLANLRKLDFGEINSFNGIEDLKNLKKLEIKSKKLNGIWISDNNSFECIIDESKTCEYSN